MYSVYVIQHNKTKELYFGKTSCLFDRLLRHNDNSKKYTKRKSGKWILIYVESFRNKKDADFRELALKKHGNGKRWLKNRIRNSMLQN